MEKITIFGESKVPVSDEKEALLMEVLEKKFDIHVTEIDREKLVQDVVEENPV